MPARADTPFDGLPIGVYRTDADGALVLVNDRWSAIAGIAPERAAGMGWADALHTDDREPALREWRRAVGEGYTGAEFRIRAANGREAWCSSAGSPVLDDDGTQVGVQIRDADITGRRRMEERLRQSEERARSIVETTSEAFVSTDADGLV